MERDANDSTRESSDSLRPCGLYRTTVELPGHRDAVGAGLLVHYHNHSDRDTSMVLLPESNTNNRWRFQSDGFSVTDSGYIASLEPLKPEGLYRLREHFHPDDGRIVAANALVQLGYNAKAEAIVFFPTWRAEDNAVSFPTKGMKIPADIYALLEQLDTRGPHAPKRLH